MTKEHEEYLQKRDDTFMEVLGIICRTYIHKDTHPMYEDRDDSAVLWEDVILPAYCHLNDADNEFGWTVDDVEKWAALMATNAPPLPEPRKPMDAC